MPLAGPVFVVSCFCRTFILQTFASLIPGSRTHPCPIDKKVPPGSTHSSCPKRSPTKAKRKRPKQGQGKQLFLRRRRRRVRPKPHRPAPTRLGWKMTRKTRILVNPRKRPKAAPKKPSRTVSSARPTHSTDLSTKRSPCLQSCSRPRQLR